MILPGFGMVSQIVSTFSSKPVFGYLGMVYAMVAIGVIGFVVWAHHMFVAGISVEHASLFHVRDHGHRGTDRHQDLLLDRHHVGRLALASARPCCGRSASSSCSPSAASRAWCSPMPAWTVRLTDTYYVVAHFHYVLSLAAVFTIFGGWYYWFPKMTGYMYSESLGKLHFWLMFIGANIAFFPMHFLG